MGRMRATHRVVERLGRSRSLVLVDRQQLLNEVLGLVRHIVPRPRKVEVGRARLVRLQVGRRVEVERQLLLGEAVQGQEDG